jgi:hypothetical protein
MWPPPGMMKQRDPDVEGCSVAVLPGAKPHATGARAAVGISRAAITAYGAPLTVDSTLRFVGEHTGVVSPTP